MSQDSSPCPICFDENPSIVLPCNCTACADCLSQWIALKISEDHYTIDSKVTCIMVECKKDLPLHEIYEKMPLHYQQKLDEALLQVYFTKEQDIRKCPNSKCEYTGIIDTKSSCTSPLQCDLCGTTWRDKNHYTKFEKIQDWFRNRSKAQAEELSQSWINQRSKKCPSCKVNIEKNGGCDHMTCKNCTYQFCWICSRRTPTHCRLTHLYRQYLIPFLAVLLILLYGIYVVYSFGLWFVLGSIGRSFLSLMCYILYHYSISIMNFIITNGLVIFTFASMFEMRVSFRVKVRNILGVVVFVAASVHFNYFSIMLYILKIEFFILLIGGICALGVRKYVQLQRRRRQTVR